MPSAGLVIRRRVSILNAPLKVDFKQAFLALGKATISGFTTDWQKTTDNLVDAATALGLKDEPDQIGWLLLYRSLVRASHDLAYENANLLSAGQRDYDRLAASVGSRLEALDAEIDERLFTHPRNVAFLQHFQGALKEWFEGFGVSPPSAEALSTRFPSYFVLALNKEWQSRPKEYEVLRQALKTPLSTATERELRWLAYSAWLQKQVDEQLFGEPFSLRQIYVPLRAFYVSGKADDRRDAGFELKSKSERIAVDLMDAVETWIRKADRVDALRVVSGGPGSGKSSFAKILAAALAEQGVRVLFIPLHHIDAAQDVEEAVGAYLKRAGFFPTSPLAAEEEEPRLILIFDGLDELAMAGKIGEQTARDFLREVQKLTATKNAQRCRIHVVMTGRELVVQSASSELRKDKQVLHVLPYFIPEDERSQYVDSSKLLSRDDRDKWWAAYGKATGKNFQTFPTVLTGREMDEITGQPLLNYLVALSFVRGKLDFTKEPNLNRVYEDLLRGVHERGYAENEHPSLKDVGEEDFIRILEEVGIAAWHGDGRTTTVREIQAHCEATGLHRLLESLQEGAKAGVTRLLTAFYFRHHGHRQDGERTFEFTHKSFGEYLAARRVVRALAIIELQVGRRRANPDDGWDERRALEHWAAICGPSSMDPYLFEFLRKEVEVREPAEVRKWQLTLAELLAAALRQSMPMEKLLVSSYAEAARQARNAEEALLAALNACARVTREPSRVPWPSQTAFGTWIARVQGQRQGAENVLALECMSYLDMGGLVLDISDLYGANLEASRLDGARLYFACLRRANLTNASLRDTEAREVRLDHANLAGAVLDGARLPGGDFRFANFAGASLQGTDLEGADLRGASVESDQLRSARIERASISKRPLRAQKLLDLESAAPDIGLGPR